MIAVLNTGGANLASVVNALERLEKTSQLTTDPEIISKASHVILPGVGAAQAAMQYLYEADLIQLITGLKQPVLGICLGMQILYDHSEEGDVKCLGKIPSRVRRFNFDGGLPVPHMGWNTIEPSERNLLLKGIDPNSYVYFVHSYRGDLGPWTTAITKYGEEFPSMVQQDNFFGVQFHPERSGMVGATILENFVQL